MTSSSSVVSQTKGSGATSGCSEVSASSHSWALKLFKAETWYSMSLGLKRLQELIQGTCSLSDDPVWLLGLWYGVQDADTGKSSMTPELHQLLLDDLNSRFWFTYRRDFPPIGSSTGLTSDVGWGCTLRSGQMLIAEALSRCWWGRTTRFAGPVTDTEADAAAGSSGAAASLPHSVPQQPPGEGPTAPQAAHVTAGEATEQLPAAATGSSGSQSVADQLQLLHLFVDHPGADAPLSIHNLCAAGAAHGVAVGQWLGPWVLCKAVAAAAAAFKGQQQQQQLRQPLGLQVHVVCDPGGGAPSLQPSQLHEILAQPEPDAAAVSNCGRSSHGGHQAAAQQQAHEQQQQQEASRQQQGLLLLVPLTLGVGKVNERYVPQLASVLTFPQSVGIVGGRPGASLYFVGVQGSSVVYLDPHEVQDAPSLPDDVGSFHCSIPRLMPLSAIDPSLAIGFFCADMSDLDDLLMRLQQLSATAGVAPLMTVEQQGAAAAAAAAGAGNAVAAAIGDAEADVEAEGCKADDWELV